MGGGSGLSWHIFNLAQVAVRKFLAWPGSSDQDTIVGEQIELFNVSLRAYMLVLVGCLLFD